MEFEVPFTLHSLHPAAFGPIYVRRAFHFPLLLYVGRFFFVCVPPHHSYQINIKTNAGKSRGSLPPSLPLVRSLFSFPSWHV